MGMSEQEFDEFVPRCVKDLERKQAGLKKRYGLGGHANWHFDQLTGLLQFSDKAGKLRVEAKATEIGSFSHKSSTWKWAWANTSVVESQRTRAAILKGLAERTGRELLGDEVFRADEGMAWEIAAMAVDHLHAFGCYRGRSGHLDVFLAIDEIRKINRSTGRRIPDARN